MKSPAPPGARKTTPASREPETVTRAMHWHATSVRRSAEVSSQRMEKVRRLTAEFRGRTPAVQHADVQDLFKHKTRSPAAGHFMVHGPLQRFVRRHVR